MPNFLARVAAATLGTATPAGLPAMAPAPGGGSWIARPPGIAADDGHPTTPPDRGADGIEASGDEALDVAPPGIEPVAAGRELSARRAGTTMQPGLALGGAPMPSPAAIRPVATAPAPGAPFDRARGGAGGVSGAARSTPPAVGLPTVAGVPPLAHHVDDVATADPARATAVRHGATTEEGEAQEASLSTAVEPGRHHVVRVPRSLRGGLAHAEPDQVGGAQSSPDDGSLRALAALLSSPVSDDDTIPEKDVRPSPARRDGVTTGSAAAPAGGIGTMVVEMPVRAEPDATGSRAGRRDAAAWHLSVGRVEVQVDNRTPPPAPPRSEPITVAVDPLERRFVDRFRLRP